MSKLQDSYTSQTTTLHRGLNVEKCGFIINPSFPELGATPDALVYCECCGKGCVEIKCPYTHHNHNLLQACEDDTFCLALTDGIVELKQTHKYYKQVQTQIFVTRSEFCDFVVWTTKACVIIRVRPDARMWGQPLQAAQEFFYKIVHMGWVCECPESRATGRRSALKFLALRGAYFYIFKCPPIDTADWGQAETTYNLYEVLFKVHKLWMSEDCWLQARLYLGLELSPEQQDVESLCFSILVGHGQSHTFRVELASELAVWEKSFQKAVFLEVQRIRSKSYLCSSQGSVLSFTIDFTYGFSCSEGSSKSVLWRYKFSQLKGSSDDGKTRVKLLFKSAESNQIEMKELEFANLTAVLHCIHSFIAAKVASMDPLFVCSFPGNYSS